MNYEVIATGSKGNAIKVENILFDCGVSFKKISHIYKDIDIVLLTHVHS